MEPISNLSAIISSGQSLSSSVDLGYAAALGIRMPSAWDAADLTFQVSEDNSSWANLYDEYGSEVTVNAAAARAITLLPQNWVGVRYLKVRSGNSSGPVSQTADRKITVIIRPV